MRFNFFDEYNRPHKRNQETQEKNKTTSTINTQDIEKFFGKSLIKILGQGPIKKIPKRSDERLRKQAEKKEAPLTPEMEAEIKELFGENHNQIISFD